MTMIFLNYQAKHQNVKKKKKKEREREAGFHSAFEIPCFAVLTLIQQDAVFIQTELCSCQYCYKML